MPASWCWALIRSCMRFRSTAPLAVERASQAIHNRWWNLASSRALWPILPPAAACFPTTHLCWPSCVCVCVCSCLRPYVTGFAHEHYTSNFPYFNMSDVMEDSTCRGFLLSGSSKGWEGCYVRWLSLLQVFVPHRWNESLLPEHIPTCM